MGACRRLRPLHRLRLVQLCPNCWRSCVGPRCKARKRFSRHGWNLGSKSAKNRTQTRLSVKLVHIGVPSGIGSRPIDPAVRTAMCGERVVERCPKEMDHVLFFPKPPLVLSTAVVCSCLHLLLGEIPAKLTGTCLILCRYSFFAIGRGWSCPVVFLCLCCFATDITETRCR